MVLPTAVTPVIPCADGDSDVRAPGRLSALRLVDDENELIKAAATRGPRAVVAVMRGHPEYAWFAALCLQAMEAILVPHSREEKDDTAAIVGQMLDMDVLEDVVLTMRRFPMQSDVQWYGLSIIARIAEDDSKARDEVARRGGCELICAIAGRHMNNPRLLYQVMRCVAYLAAEDYIEVMLCGHGALEHVAFILREYADNVELVTQTSTALLNLTACEHHVETLQALGALPNTLRAFESVLATDKQGATLLCGVLANLSVSYEAREFLVEFGVFQMIAAAMKLDAENAELQLAGLKSIVNYTLRGDHVEKMANAGLPQLVDVARQSHPKDVELQKYANYFKGNYTGCPLM
eukprot:TRINITY_DN14782_c0_g5_i1.p1 TRINITY_DN14782_c0_g5~~TRINITY_DN14782_c0_g5_i1.p1  ORF type:complete len:350 (-),score=68.16 TRINITY_DN14782_c0_g5_i1:135-1184(-)